jgi:hypothetical protein
MPSTELCYKEPVIRVPVDRCIVNIPEVLGSNLVRDTGYPCTFSSWFSQTKKEKFCIIHRLNHNRFLTNSYTFGDYPLAAAWSKMFRNLSKKEISQLAMKRVSFHSRQMKSRNRKAKWQRSIAVSPSQTASPHPPAPPSHSYLLQQITVCLPAVHLNFFSSSLERPVIAIYNHDSREIYFQCPYKLFTAGS